MLVSPTAPASAADATVSIEDDRFEPREVAVGVGERVGWSRGTASTGPHNVRQDERLFSSGPTTEGPIDYEVRLSAGTFHYFCEAHGSRVGGMDGVIRVAPSVEAAPADRRFTVVWATPGTATGSRFDVQYRRGGRWTEWKENSRAGQAVFGKQGQPERVRASGRYRFRVRSMRGRHASAWSPRATFVVE
jgi:plastocyanin